MPEIVCMSFGGSLEKNASLSFIRHSESILVVFLSPICVKELNVKLSISAEGE